MGHRGITNASSRCEAEIPYIDQMESALKARRCRKCAKKDGLCVTHIKLAAQGVKFYRGGNLRV